MTDRAAHWEGRYRATDENRLGWYRPHLDTSLELIDSLCADDSCRIIDVGGGASTLVDDLLARGHSNIAVLDLAASALTIARQRLGSQADQVKWIVGDVLTTDLGLGSYDLWHDRAVFHFLTRAAERRAYLDRLRRALASGGRVVIGTFAPSAPEVCSGLQVQRYDHDQLAAVFGADFRLLAATEEAHRTPGGTDQPYTYALFEYVNGAEHAADR